MYALTLLTYFETFWFFLVSGCDAVSRLQCPLHERDGLCCHALPLRIHVPCDSTAANLHVLCRTSKCFGEVKLQLFNPQGFNNRKVSSNEL